MKATKSEQHILRVLASAPSGNSFSVEAILAFLPNSSPVKKSTDPDGYVRLVLSNLRRVGLVEKVGNTWRQAQP